MRKLFIAVVLAGTTACSLYFSDNSTRRGPDAGPASDGGHGGYPDAVILDGGGGYPDAVILDGGGGNTDAEPTPDGGPGGCHDAGLDAGPPAPDAPCCGIPPDAHL